MCIRDRQSTWGIKFNCKSHLPVQIFAGSSAERMSTQDWESVAMGLREKAPAQQSQGGCPICQRKEKEDLCLILHVLITLLQPPKNAEEPLGGGNPFKYPLVRDSELETSDLGMFTAELVEDVTVSTFFNSILSDVFKNKYGEEAFSNLCDHRYIKDFVVKIVEEQRSANLDRRSDVNAKEVKTRLMGRLNQLSVYIRRMRVELNNFEELLANIPNVVKDTLKGSYGDGDGQPPIATVRVPEQAAQEDPERLTSDKLQALPLSDVPQKRRALESQDAFDRASSNSSTDSTLNRRGEGDNSCNRSDVSGSGTKNKLPKKATEILKNWFLQNIHNPYPNSDVKEYLSKATGLNKKQIQNWFTNSRKRYLEPLKRKLRESVSTGSSGNGYNGLPNNSFSAAVNQQLSSKSSQLSNPFGSGRPGMGAPVELPPPIMHNPPPLSAPPLPGLGPASSAPQLLPSFNVLMTNPAPTTPFHQQSASIVKPLPQPVGPPIGQPMQGFGPGMNQINYLANYLGSASAPMGPPPHAKNLGMLMSQNPADMFLLQQQPRMESGGNLPPIMDPGFFGRGFGHGLNTSSNGIMFGGNGNSMPHSFGAFLDGQTGSRQLTGLSGAMNPMGNPSGFMRFERNDAKSLVLPKEEKK
eukprot:TRINITY_DN5925_c0_g1_i1.p1 TRINITY_DN5925_c0_g1~~TRINITY_DN5925_c0_g1_i1.p1  ORF type:complete len:654 (+),score=123.91 TRINITY_DN5925_c0_g1_i1:47-1963(+)